MGSVDSQAYLEVMVQPFMDALSVIDGPRVASGELPLVAVIDVQSEVFENLDALDWDALGLPDRDFNVDDNEIGEKSEAPQHFARRLAMFAFSDVMSIAIVCEESQKQQGIDVEMGPTLLRSKK